MHIPRLMLCGVQSGSGKTTVTCGLLQALVNRGLRTAAFKCGPDYIDPMFHATVIGAKTGNLDAFFTPPETLRFLLAREAAGMDISVLEGVMGYYDGIAATSRASSYEVAVRTGTSAVLVVPAKGMGVSVAALVGGYCGFQPDSNIRGVILNRVAPGLYEELKEQIESRCSVRVYGYVPELKDLTVESRHLGLSLPGEVDRLREKLNRLAARLEETVDVDGLLRLAEEAADLTGQGPELRKGEPVRLGIARDAAFCFYYRENLELLEELGAELVPFSPLEDRRLPEGISGLLLGGGYPELHCEELLRNDTLRDEIRARIAAGLPTIAECGGFLYLQEILEDMEGRAHPMAGVIPGKGWYTGRLRRFGYVTLRAQADSLYGPAGTELRGHEFHYFDTEDPGEDFRAVKPVRGTQWPCIHSRGNLLCGFPHVYLYSNPACGARFLDVCRAWGREAAL